MGYMWNDIHVEQMNNISSSSKNLTSMSLPGKNAFLRLFTNYKHKNANTNGAFNRFATYSWTTLIPALSSQIILVTNKVGLVFVPIFHHE